MKLKLYNLFFKRLFDIIYSIIGIAITLPFLIILLPTVSFFNRGPIFFTQLRPGRNGRLFRLIKFKTMNDKIDERGKLLPDRERLTKTGYFIRSLSLDELPQLLNVFRGDMSIVGPRPLLKEYLPLYNANQARRHEVRPGITGLAQVRGRNSITWEEKLENDVWYVDNMSFGLDFRIIFLSIFKVLKREGISASGTATMKPFTGAEASK